MKRQPTLFDLPPKRRTVRAHMVEGGDEAVRFACRCGWESGWLRYWEQLRPGQAAPPGALTEGQVQRGIPCPQCNGDTK